MSIKSNEKEIKNDVLMNINNNNVNNSVSSSGNNNRREYNKNAVKEYKTQSSNILQQYLIEKRFK